MRIQKTTHDFDLSRKIVIDSMDFQNLNPINMQINMFSGNLFPMTSDGTQFPIFWKIYSSFLWISILIRTVGLIASIMFVSKKKFLATSTVPIMFITDVLFMTMRIHAHSMVMRRFIKKLNNILRTEDETMKKVVTTTMKTIKIVLNFYWVIGLVAIFIKGMTPMLLIFKKSDFYCDDFIYPVALFRQPFSTGIFVLGNFFVLICGMYVFLKKVSIDIYMVHLVLMITTQYRYIAAKLALLFREDSSQDIRGNSQNDYRSRINSWADMEMKAICRHHNTVIHLSFMLKRLLCLNFSIIYINSILRFSFIGMMMSTIFSISLIEGIMIIMFSCGEMIQFYILCFTVQQLLDASTKMTDLAFHGNWYQFEPSIKRSFLLIMLHNNIECKFAKINKFNLSLPSFMTVMNQAYTITLLLLKVK